MSLLPTYAELDILAALWRLGPSTVREVHQALGKPTGYTTTLKQLQVMAEKRLLSRTQRYRAHVYEAVAGEETRRRIAGDLLRRAFEGSVKDLVLSALEAHPISDEDLADVLLLLRNFKRRRKPREPHQEALSNKD
jgi:predicted transcriptional regulator